MLQTYFLKLSARKELKGEYIRAVIGALIFFIPSYLMTKILDMAIQFGTIWYMGALILQVIATIFVIDIFNVGFIRSLMRMKDRESITDDGKRYDYGLVLSGFGENYPNTLKIMFRKNLYIFGWELLALLPILTVVGIIAFLSGTAEVAGLIDMIGQFYASPSPDMMTALGEYVVENCLYITFILPVAYILTIVLLAFVIRKQYEYAMIPMIVAEDPDVPAKEAFKKTREIMHGFRMKYFLLELSFVGWMFLVVLVSGSTMFPALLYVAYAFLLPYMNMTYIEFYKERKLMIEPVEGEDNNEN